MAVEFALLAPAFIVLMLLLVLGGRMIEAQGQVDGAARDAARAASVQDLANNVPAAIANAADSDLYSHGHEVCTTTPAWTWHPGPGNAEVSVTVTCSVNLAFFPGLSTHTVTGHAVAPLDTYVQRNW